MKEDPSVSSGKDRVIACRCSSAGRQYKKTIKETSSQVVIVPEEWGIKELEEEFGRVSNILNYLDPINVPPIDSNSVIHFFFSCQTYEQQLEREISQRSKTYQLLGFT